MPIPKELKNFLERRGTTLLVRGEPGTGKTKLALELMKTFNLAYVGTKRSIEEIKSEYSWLDEELEKKLFYIDEKYDYKDTDTFGAVFYLIPESMRKVLNLFEDGAVAGIIVDSWHSIISELNILAMEEQERAKIYESSAFFLKLIRLSENGVNFIIVREGNEDDNISYLSDGVLTLNKKVEDGRIYRWFTIDKLRGEEVEKSSYLFTLKDNKFAYLHSRRFKHPSRIHGFENSAKEVSSAYFDNIFTVSRNDTIVFDFGEFLPTSYRITALMGFIASFASQNSRVLIIPPNGFDMSDLKYNIYLFGLEKYYRNIAYLYGEESMESFAKRVDFSDYKSIVDIIKDELSEHSSEFPPLVIIGYDRLSSYLSSKENMRALYRIKDAIKESGGVMLITGNIMGEENKKFCSGVSDTYIKFKNIGGDVIMYGIKPWTRVYHVDISYQKYPKLLTKVIA